MVRVAFIARLRHLVRRERQTFLHLFLVALTSAHSRLGREGYCQVFTCRRVTGIEERSNCGIASVRSLVRRVIRGRRHVARFVNGGTVHRARVVFMVGCVRIIGRTFVHSVSSNGARRLIRSERYITRASVYFRNGRIRYFQLY